MSSNIEFEFPNNSELVYNTDEYQKFQTLINQIIPSSSLITQNSETSISTISTSTSTTKPTPTSTSKDIPSNNLTSSQSKFTTQTSTIKAPSSINEKNPLYTPSNNTSSNSTMPRFQIGRGFELGRNDYDRLQARYDFNTEFAIVYLVILVIYWVYVLYSLVTYYVRTSPYRRGIEHRSMFILKIQTFCNLGAATILLVYISYNYVFHWLLLIFLYVMLSIWVFSIVIRSIQLNYAIRLNFSRYICYSVIKAGTAYELQEDIDNLKQFKNQYLAFINESQIDYVQAINYYQDKLTKLIKNKKWYSNRIMLMVFASTIVLMIAFMFASVKITNIIKKWDFADINSKTNLYTHPSTLIFLVFFGLIIFIVFPFFIYKFYSIKEARFLKIELIMIFLTGLITYIVMGTWNHLNDNFVRTFSQYNFFFIMLLTSHICAISYPYIKLKNFMIVVSQDDFESDSRRKTISSFGSINSRFSLKVDDYRSKFVTMLDSPAKYRMFSNCANQYLCSPLVLFLDEYQTLKRRIMTEFEQNHSLKTAYKTMLKLNNNIEENEDNNFENVDEYSFGTFDTNDVSTDPSTGNSLPESTNNPSSQILTSENSLGQNSENLYLLENRSEKILSDGFHDTNFNQLMHTNPISPTICSSLEYLFPSCDISSSHPVPQSLFQLFKSFYSVFIDPNSELNVGVHVYLTYEISQQIESNEYTLGMFDDAREEVLELLYFGVFPRYLESQKSSKRSNKFPTQISSKFFRFYRSNRS
ncbi:hypothetical protein BB561_004001 [Smittium simulii]|uniref:RGS domain-containing protein n=1 Tax=Smittium simulii TaxID=133385 RepID=A0A2T9YII2_9FUNG|nr:hypothetical protein BB561_004001 [Smittium simulii]